MKIAFGLNLAFTILEFFGGWISGSIAILSDAVHDLGDTASLGLALFLAGVARRAQPTHRFTYGKDRFTLAGALANALVLVFGSALILREAVSRFASPSKPEESWMFAFALVGVAVNGYAAWRASRGHTLNEKVVSWHLMEDVAGWIAVLLGSLVLFFTDWYWIDPALAIGISLFILFNVVRRLRDVSELFLQASPPELDVGALEADLQKISGVGSIHHLHAWSLDGERHVLSCHAVMECGADIDDYRAVRRQIREVLSRTSSGHITVELEFAEEDCPERETEAGQSH